MPLLEHDPFCGLDKQVLHYYCLGKQHTDPEDFDMSQIHEASEAVL